MRVAVAGALGRMGRAVCGALTASEDLQLVGGFDRSQSGANLQELLSLSRPSGKLFDDFDALYEEAKPDIVVDFTVYPISLDVSRGAVERGISPVIGATGWTDEDVVAFRDLCDEQGVAALIAPNFSIGAVLMMRFSEEAAKHFPTVEIIELHHDAKIDAPSGTARLTGRRIEEVRAQSGITDKVAIHSVRLRGLVAHQEVLFGGTDELLTIRHDSMSRQSFMPGVVLACRRVRQLQGLVVGLEHLLDV
jgi:4-hydroxy-tetrahydrodipicolinate reductase